MRHGCYSLPAFLFTLPAVLALVAPQASAQMKEGTVKGTYSSFGTFKATSIGKERLFIAFEENGPQLSDGFADHITWHCWGTVEYSKGEGQGQGHCVGTDPSGDQIAMTVNDEKHKLDQKSWNGSWTYIGGSGKYTELTGGGKYVAHGNEFRTAAEGTYVGYNTFEGRYKLP